MTQSLGSSTKYLWDEYVGGVSQRWGGEKVLLEGHPGGTGLTQQEGEERAGIAETSISPFAQEARGQLGLGCFKISLVGEWQVCRAWGSSAPAPDGGQPGRLGAHLCLESLAPGAMGTLPWHSSLG